MQRYAGQMVRHSTDSGLSERDRNVLQKRQEHRWFVTTIAEDGEGPGCAYSFGLYEEFQHPEIITFGLAPDVMHRLIDDVGKQIQNGTRYRDGAISRQLLEGLPCAFRSVNPLHYRETFTWAVWFYENASFPALQLFWPDKDCRFP